MRETGGLKRNETKAPIFAHASRVIGASSLDRNEKSVMRALLQWWNPRSGELWPSMRSIADATGFTVRGIQKIIRRLEAAGVLVEQRQPTAHGEPRAPSRTKVFRIEFGSMTANPGGTNSKKPSLATISCDSRSIGMTCEETILKNEKNSFVGERRSSTPRTADRATPEPGSSEACNMEPSTETPHRHDGDSDVIFSTNGCVDGAIDSSARRTELLNSGVRGRLLLELSKCELLTPQLIRDELIAAKRDRTCRNIPAVLVSRLASIAGIELNKRRILTREQRRFQEVIERRRREFGIRI